MRSGFRRNFGIFSVENWGTKSLQAHQAPDFRMRKAMLCAAMRSMFHTVWVCLGAGNECLRLNHSKTQHRKQVAGEFSAFAEAGGSMDIGFTKLLSCFVVSFVVGVLDSQIRHMYYGLRRTMHKHLVF